MHHEPTPHPSLETLSHEINVKLKTFQTIYAHNPWQHVCQCLLVLHADTWSTFLRKRCWFVIKSFLKTQTWPFKYRLWSSDIFLLPGMNLLTLFDLLYSAVWWSPVLGGGCLLTAPDGLTLIPALVKKGRWSGVHGSVSWAVAESVCTQMCCCV